MRPGRATPLTLTRRALGTRLAGFAAAIGLGQSAATSVAAQTASAMDPELRDAALSPPYSSKAEGIGCVRLKVL
jgi:anti-sigma factor RsiW